MWPRQSCGAPDTTQQGYATLNLGEKDYSLTSSVYCLLTICPSAIWVRANLALPRGEPPLEVAKHFQETLLIFSFECSLHECFELLELLGRESGLRRSASIAWHAVLMLRTNQVSIATQKTNISSSLFHYVPRMARCAASQPLLLAGPLDAGPLRAPAIRGVEMAWGN